MTTKSLELRLEVEQLMAKVAEEQRKLPLVNYFVRPFVKRWDQQLQAQLRILITRLDKLDESREETDDDSVA